MKVNDNYESKIWLGLQEGYSSKFFDSWEVTQFIKDYCSKKGQCVTVTPTNFIYVNGQEPGLIIGFINYPRYPMSKAELRNRTIELGKLLMEEYKQFRVSLTFYPAQPGGVMMLENEEME